MKTKYAEVTISNNKNSFVLNETTQPRTTKTGGRAWKVLARIANGGTPKELAEKAKSLGYTLISEPSETSVFYMRGNLRLDWNGQPTERTGLENTAA